jgi:exodeoxyribonuclease-5
MSWSPQQDAAITAVRKWLKNPRGQQVFRLFGYAGSGKTTLAKHLAEDVDGTVLYACFTGKAALVLRKKGCDGASTIHGLIYKALQDPVTGHTEFILNPDSPLATAALLVIDEVSMVGEELAQDLLSFGIPVLVLGDPAQLPPVKGEGFFINAEPDVMLTEIHRQAAENPIIRMSMDIREGRGLAVGRYGDSIVIARGSIDKDRLREYVLQSDQMLCGMNKTRQTFNARIRDLRGRAGSPERWMPTKGDKLVCLKNNHTKGLLNGGLWQVEKTSNQHRNGSAPTFEMQVSSLDSEGVIPLDVTVRHEFFLGSEKEIEWRERRKSDEFTYGDALTVHKSQGSQWDNVLLYDESGVFREDAAKHQYTGVTRAAERVVVVV